MLKAFQFMARVLAAMAAVVIVAVLESGRWIFRAVRAVMAPVPPIPAAIAEQEAEFAQPVPAAPAPPSTAEAWGRGALHFLLGDDTPEARCLDSAARAYLDALTADQGVALSRHGNTAIGQHLLGEDHLPGLPRAMTPAEFVAIEARRLHAASAAASNANEQRAYIQDVLDDLVEHTRLAA
ncbi:hypothetical protein [uncultured Methylobacterium sp.]|uniref:hypothetical protein n=1 Tax=uncultured Methylobacterium sp. TaxID=157278 RepID=UPI0035CB2EF0